MWSHSARLVVAASVSDSLLAGELRRLGTSYGVQVQSFNLSNERLATWPIASDILQLPDDAFEKLRSETTLSSLSAASVRSALDWDHIRDMMTQSSEFKDIFEWIARCLRDSRAYTFQKYRDLRNIEREPG